jgi:hypothetical protein
MLFQITCFYENEGGWRQRVYGWQINLTEQYVLSKIWSVYSSDYEECRLQPPAHAASSLADFSTLKMEAINPSETSVRIRSTRRHNGEDGIP